MAVITSSVTGNFSAPGTWVGGVVPGPADDAVAATGTVVTIDTDVTVLSFQQNGTGKFVLGGGRTVTGNVIGNAGAYNTGGATVEVTATTGQTATINGNITGSGSTTQFSCGVNVTGLGAFILNGNITGFSGNLPATTGAPALYTNVSCTITVNGNITGATGNLKQSVWTDTLSLGSLTVNGNILGGTGVGTHGLLVQGASSVAVTGNVTGSAGSNSVGIATTGNSTVNIFGNVLGGSSGACYGVSASGGSAAVNVTGNVTAGTGNALGILTSGSGAAVNVTGDVTGTSATGIYSSGSAPTTTVVGNVTAGTGTNVYGIHMVGASAVVLITGNVTANTGTSNWGLYMQGASSLATIVGNLFAIGLTSSSVRSDATSANSGVVLTGNMTDSSLGAMACSTRIFRLNATTLGTTTYANNVGYPAGGSVTRVSPDLTTGMPVASNVRSGLVYGYNNQLLGQAAIPPAASVAAGVEVDNTTGTAALDAGSVIAVIGAQIAAASSDPVGI